MNVRHLIIATLMLAALSGCGQTAANTQVMVTVDAEDGVRGAAQLVLVRVYGGPRGTAQADMALVQDYPIGVPPHNGWPLVIALAPLDRDPTRIYRVEAIAYDVPDHEIVPAPTPIATVRAFSGYVAGQTVLLRLLLQDSCLGMPCEDITETCAGGACVSAEVDETMLPPFGSDAGPRPDTNRPVDEAGVDAGSDAGAGCTDESCEDGLSCTTDFCTAEGCGHMAQDASCDDSNPCTTDRCDGSTGDGCTHVANADACDDGMFCNGFDTCAGSTCSVHAGFPCDALDCDEDRNACTGCSAAAPCPLPVAGPYSACTHASFCAESGTQSRVVRTSTCNTSSMECEYVDAPETSSCEPRPTAGLPCMTRSCDLAGACTFADACDRSGSAPRTCQDFECAAGSCVGTSYSDPVVCPRTTDGNTCDDLNPCTSTDQCSAGICSGSPSCDGGTDGGMDAGTDAYIDPGPDAGPDAYSVDAAGGGPDATVPIDAWMMMSFDSMTAGPRLVINEIDYDQPSTDTAEFVEIFNAGSAPQILSGIVVVLIDGTTNAEYGRATLTGSLNPGQYLVVNTSTSSVPGASTFATAAALRNGTDAVVLWDTGGRRVIDAFSYEGDVGLATISAPGGMSGVDVVEGIDTFSQDSGTTASASMCRMPNGRDTDSRGSDWTLCTSSPGSAN